MNLELTQIIPNLGLFIWKNMWITSCKREEICGNWCIILDDLMCSYIWVYWVGMNTGEQQAIAINQPSVRLPSSYQVYLQECGIDTSWWHETFPSWLHLLQYTSSVECEGSMEIYCSSWLTTGEAPPLTAWHALSITPKLGFSTLLLYFTLWIAPNRRIFQENSVSACPSC